MPVASGNSRLLSVECKPLLSYGEGARVVGRLSYPIIISNIFNALADTLTYFLVGDLSATSLASLGLGLMVNRLFSCDIITAFMSGFDTLGSQCYGKGEYRMCGVYMYRAWIILQLIGLPSYILVMFSDSILMSVGVTEEAATLSAALARRMIPYNILMNTFQLLNRFLIVQRIVKPQMVINAVTCCLHPVWVYIFVFIFRMDYVGTAYAYGLTNLLNTVAVVAYIYYSGQCKETLPKLDASAFVGWWSFLKIAGPSGFMYIMEGHSYLIINILTGRLDAASIAANQALCNLLSLNYNVPVALGYATCALVGNSLGSRNPDQAKRYAKLTITLNTAIICTSMVFMFAFRRGLAELYSVDVEVQKVFAATIPLMLWEVLVDTTQGILCRVLVAMARQPFAFVANVILYFVYMVPIVTVLMLFCNWGIIAIWFGLATAYIGSVSAFGYKILSEDWDKVSIEAAERIERDRLQMNSALKLKDDAEGV